MNHRSITFEWLEASAAFGVKLGRVVIAPYYIVGVDCGGELQTYDVVRRDDRQIVASCTTKEAAEAARDLLDRKV